MAERLAFTLNGAEVSVDRPQRGHLADLLRREFRLTGTHLGCEHGVCGACNVVLDGEVVRGCLTLAGQIEGRRIDTIEGLTADGSLAALQEAFIARNALQCGFCTPGMLLTARELLRRTPLPGRDEIREAISGNLCRCTGYHAIVDAIADVAGNMKADAPADCGIGARLPRPDARRAAEGRARYLDDIAPARTGHVAFLRSPYAHARIVSVDASHARAMPGVIACFTGADLAAVSPSWTTSLAGVRQHRSPPQPAMAVTESCWQGEAVAAVVAESRAEAEDAAEAIEIEFEELPAVTCMRQALDGAAVVHSSLDTNLALDHSISAGDPDAAFAAAALVVEQDFAFNRQTGVSLEPRGTVAEYDAGAATLTVHQSHQAPWQMREIFAEQLGLDPEQVRVVVPDVGGAFGLKLHAYADEMAVVAMSRLLDRPVKFVADRIESFVSDAHAREATVKARLAVDSDGRLLAFDVEVTAGFGAYSMYPRGSVGEALQAMQMVGAPYAFDAFRGRVRGVLQNKAPTGAYRGVGQPIACAVTEQLMDLAAAGLGMDPVEIRRLNYHPTPEPLNRTLAGVVLEPLSLRECLERLEALADLPALRADQALARPQGILRGIGIASFVEMTGVGSRLYGPLGVKVAANEAVRLTLDAGGSVRCETSITDQGQGTASALRQVVAEGLGISPDGVRVVHGDTARTPYGGGAWASRGMSLGGEAALVAAERLRANVLAIASVLLQRPSEGLRVAAGTVVDENGRPTLTLAEIAGMARYRASEIPLSPLPPLSVEESFQPEALPYLTANGVVAVHVEVDAGTGITRVLGVWAVDDCGRIVNPLLVDEQMRGAIVQGIGAALFEECAYTENGQLENGTLADYLMPMASEMPDIHVDHVSTPTRATKLGAKGVGEAGVVATPAAIRCAINDALRPLGAQVTRQPYGPDRVLEALYAAKA